MSCKPFKTSEANAKSYLKTKGAIDAFLNILNLNVFRKENINLSEQARKKGVTFEGNIFLEDNGKAVPRRDIFKQIDTVNGVYYQIESVESEDVANIPTEFFPSQFVTIYYDENKKRWYEDVDSEAAPMVETGVFEITYDQAVKAWNHLNNIIPPTIKSLQTVSKKNEQLKNDMFEFAQINGIKVEFVDSLVEQFGGDYNAAYDAVSKTIYVNKHREAIDTLPEEIAHILTIALGDEHTLVKKALNLLSKTDYKSTLDPKYVELYKNNENALKHEYLGKVIAQVLVNKYEPKTESEFKLLGAIKQLIDKFLSLFNPNDRIESIAKELATKITNKELVTFGNEVSKENSVYFQVDAKKSKEKSKIEDIKEQYVYLKQHLRKEMNILQHGRFDDEYEYTIQENKVKKLKAQLEDLESTGNKQIIINLGNEILDNYEQLLNDIEDPDVKRTGDFKTLSAMEIAFNKFIQFPGLADRSVKLKNRLVPIMKDEILKQANLRANEEGGVTEEQVYGQSKDISKIVGWFGKLSNSNNIIARTIGAMIKEVQSKVSAEHKETLHEVNKQVDELREWSKANGISEANMYDVFIQEYNGTTVLTRKFTSEFYDLLKEINEIEDTKQKIAAKKQIATYDSTLKEWIPKDKKYINSNYTKIMNTPALKKFYEFHKKLTKEASKKLPVAIGPDFIANIASNNLTDLLKVGEGSKSQQMMELLSNVTGIDIKQFEDGTFVADEDLFQDVIPLKWIKSMDASSKSKNLGDNLAKFVNFANNYEQMSEILPTIRSMQNQLGRQSFTKSANPGIAIQGTETNLYKFIQTVIDMQVKGNTKLDEGKIKVGNTYDSEGNPTGEKYIHASALANFGMKYNSLLRIGLNPINAVTNLLVGDIGNIIEAFGGRFYTMKNLKDASNVFFKDAFKEDSDLNKWRDKIGPLQELEDYESVEQVSSKGRITKEKIENAMYMPQKMGEVWLQNRTMVAILMKDGYMDASGKTTPKGENITQDELNKLINKVYEVNNKIHGRYSARDAAAISQQVLPRMIMQFKKWIPAAIESRFETKYFNNDLGVEVEGRYKTGWRILKKVLQGNLSALQKANMTETEYYNMRKNYAELVVALGSMLAFIGMGAFGDDDEELKKNPYYKFTMNQLDRISGDLLYFYNPGSYTETALKPIALAKTTHDLIGVVTAFPHIFGLQGDKDIYQSGDRAGENKFLAKMIDATPVLSPIAKTTRMFKDEKYREYNSQ